MKGFPLLPSLVTSDPPAHTHQRTLVTKALSLRRLAGFEARRVSGGRTAAAVLTGGTRD
jgi:cytochrome P450